jgi:glycosyltransferase involved in cell wall biosynthesis
MYFSKHLKDLGIEPIVLTIDEKKAAYKYIDNSFLEIVKGITTYKTSSFEILKLYSYLVSGDSRKGIPMGIEHNISFFQKIARFIRGNFFIPDARIGWNKYALHEAIKIIEKNKINTIITTGPPHSTHLIGISLKNKMEIKWIADFRDPWAELHYNKMMYRSGFAQKKDLDLEIKVLKTADHILTIGPSLRELLLKKIPSTENKISYIYNGYDQGLFEDLKANKSDVKFTMTHVGVLSDSQPLTPFIIALSLLFKNETNISSKFKLILIGNVGNENINSIKSIVPELEIELIPYVQHKLAIQHMLDANLLLNSLAESEHSKIMISGKLMEYAYSKTPILCLGDPESDAAKLLVGYTYAKVIDRQNLDQIYNFIFDLYNKWKNKIETINENPTHAITRYSRLETTRELYNLLKSF